MYCNLKRLEPTKSKHALFDSDIQKQITYTGESKKDIDNCRTSNPVKSPYIQAYTTGGGKITPKANQIQICPCKLPMALPGSKLTTVGYIDHSCMDFLPESCSCQANLIPVNQKFDESKGYTMKRIAAKLFDSLWGPFRDTPIDGLALFPVTMLHEVNHQSARRS